jgi:hypothetical protein
MTFMQPSEMTMTDDTTKPVKTRPATFSPEAVAEIVGKALAEQRAEFLAAMAAQQQAEKPATMAIAGKSDQAVKNELATIKAFHKAGFKDAKPHVNILTFNKWVEKGFRPIEGSKSLRINNLRLFHVSQVRKLTAEDKAKAKDQKAAHEARAKAKGNVTELHPATP